MFCEQLFEEVAFVKVAVVLVGYSRPKSLKRLFESVRLAYEFDCVDVIFSIDRSPAQSQVLSCVDSLIKDFGNCSVRAFNERLGLREHILACGDLIEDYDALIVLEDDIVVSDSFLRYVYAAIEFVKEDENIAGISLYAPAINEMSLLPFTPKRNGFDNFYLQSAQSWGQCWTKKMWSDFRAWYDANSGYLDESDDMPSRIYSWPKTSWKKYHMKYLAESGKTLFYPYDSLSSNYSDVGQHNKSLTPFFQVPLISGKKEFLFGARDEVPCYDIFFERTGFKYNDHPLCLDIYGTKKISKSRFILTPKKLDVPKLHSFGLTYRPQEDNYINLAPGDDLHLYDLGERPGLRMKEASVSFRLARYHTNLSWRHSLVYGLNTLKSRILHKLKGK
jgi:hypothetical protein